MFLQFLDLYGNPVYLRPDRVDALRGMAVTHDGQLRAGTMVLMTNRETFRLRGHVDTISEAVSRWIDEHSPKLTVGETLIRSDEARPDGTTVTTLSRSVDQSVGLHRMVEGS